MLETHPTLTTRVILDSEANLSSTLQVLQEELDLRYADFKSNNYQIIQLAYIIKLWSIKSQT